MNSFSSAISAGLHGYGQKLWCNRGMTDLPAGAAAWLALDASASPPDVVAEEGAFAIMWGRTRPGSSRVKLEKPSRHLEPDPALKSRHLQSYGSRGRTVGTDNWGKPVTFVQSLWYALGSFLLARTTC